MSEQIPALTIMQPWAQLIVDGKKRVENRRVPCRQFRRFAIHAGKGRAYWKRSSEGYRESQVEWGAVVGFADLVACVPIENVRDEEVVERFPWLADHEYTEGPFCLVLENVVKLDDPIRNVSGSQGWWKFTIPGRVSWDPTSYTT